MWKTTAQSMCNFKQVITGINCKHSTDKVGYCTMEFVSQPVPKLTVTRLIFRTQTSPAGIRRLIAPHHIVTANAAVISTTHATAVKPFGLQPPRPSSHTKATPMDTKHHVLSVQNWTIHFKWVKAHIGIEGDEAADKLAKEAAQNEEDQNIVSR